MQVQRRTPVDVGSIEADDGRFAADDELWMMKYVGHCSRKGNMEKKVC